MHFGRQPNDIAFCIAAKRFNRRILISRLTDTNYVQHFANAKPRKRQRRDSHISNDPPTPLFRFFLRIRLLFSSIKLLIANLWLFLPVHTAGSATSRVFIRFANFTQLGKCGIAFRILVSLMIISGNAAL